MVKINPIFFWNRLFQKFLLDIVLQIVFLHLINLWLSQQELLWTLAS